MFTILEESISIEEFYSMLRDKMLEKDDDSFEAISLTKQDSLVPTLRSYQESAVKWMLHREKYNKLSDHQNLFVKQTFSDLEVYFHEVLGHFITPQVYADYIANFKLSFGGILADEMGLGKTVETLALILQNRKLNIQPRFSLDRSNLFFYSNNPLFGNKCLFTFESFLTVFFLYSGTLQCYCGNVENVSVIENKAIDFLIETSLGQNYYLNDNLIKCLFCGNYQHIECSRYEIGAGNFIKILIIKTINYTFKFKF